MNWDQIEGKWTELKGDIRAKWAKMTDSDYEAIGGKKDQFAGWLQKNYGYTKERIEQEIDGFRTAHNVDPNAKSDVVQTEVPVAPTDRPGVRH